MWKSKFGLSNGGTDKRPGGDVGSKSAGKGGEPAAPPTPGNENGRGERSKKSGEFHDWRLDSNFDSSLTTTRDLDDLMNTLAVSPPPPPRSPPLTCFPLICLRWSSYCSLMIGK